ncbi:MAG: hypothetical protein PHF86_12500 [Candidatus Nanoarchaeia archaeon]|nr:hypothetical protein [Candidatus Nanoarchaeia archaeon]
MSWWVWLLIILGVIIAIIIFIKFLTRNKGESFDSGSGGSLIDRAKNVGSKFKDCCMKIAGRFGGGS